MSNKSKIILCLFVVATILFCIIQFGIIPANREKQEAYARRQTDALTHDITRIEEYKSPYIGNAGNIGNLFWNLPLNNVDMKFEINSEICTLTVNYLDTVGNIGEEKVQRDLIYNSAAAMAAIDNLSGITYNFFGESYSFSRKQIEKVFGRPLSELLEQEKWSSEVQDKLKKADFVGQFFS